MPSSIMVLLALMTACRLAPRMADLLTATLATAIAFALCLRHARASAALLNCAIAPRRLNERLWLRDRREQRLLYGATRDVVSAAEFFTQYPFASARGKALADELQRWLRG
jgi:hypothetical protein